MNNKLLSQSELHASMLKLRKHIMLRPGGVYYEGAVDIDDVLSTIDHFPTIDAEPVRHATWMPTEYDEHKCSECGGREDYWWADKGTPFCPWCGAKMDGGAEE